MTKKIENAFWKASCLVPLKWRLQYRALLSHLRIRKMEDEWHRLSCLGPNRGVAIDIGANKGLYSLRLAALYEKVYAFEPNEEISRELVAYSNSKISVKQVALSSQCGPSLLFVPVSNKGEVLDGWASLNPENLAKRRELRELVVSVTTLDQLNLVGVTFIKMDVEGHELEVLRGGTNLLSSQRPTLLIEIRDEHLAETCELLEKVGLYRRDIYQRIGVPASREMYLFDAGGPDQ